MTDTGKMLGYKTKRERNLFLLCWLAYSTTYVCRYNFSCVIPQLLQQEVFTESKISAISSAFFVCYGVGQFISGIIGDRINTRYMIFVGTAFSAVSNMLIFFIHSYAAILILWAVNGALQSLVWSPILKIASVEYDDSTKERFGMQMSATVPAGTLLSYGVSLLTMLVLPWKYVFLVCGAVLFAMSLVWIFGTKPLNLKKNISSSDGTQTVGLKRSVKIMLSGGVLIFIIPIVVQGTLKDSVTQWVPEYFSSRFNAGTSNSLLLTMVLPFVNVTGAYFAKLVNNKLRSELKTSAVFFTAALAFLLVLWLGAAKSIVLSLICIVMITNCMFAVNVMLITMVPLKFSKQGIVSTAAGALNSVAYIGCALMNRITGSILQNGSWNAVIIFWICLAVAAVVICLIPEKKTKIA